MSLGGTWTGEHAGDAARLLRTVARRGRPVPPAPGDLGRRLRQDLGADPWGGTAEGGVWYPSAARLLGRLGGGRRARFRGAAPAPRRGRGGGPALSPARGAGGRDRGAEGPLAGARHPCWNFVPADPRGAEKGVFRARASACPNPANPSLPYPAGGGTHRASDLPAMSEPCTRRHWPNPGRWTTTRPDGARRPQRIGLSGST